ncbi:MAG: DUF1697 domain-containing protein [Candidatus Limnocylindria bacterium]
MDAHVAFLRGINLAGKNRLPMKDLSGLFTDAGCADVRTHIQSGNVVFRAPPGLARRIPDLIQKAISNQFGISVPVVTRSAAELRKVAQANPYLARDKDTSALHVAFLAAKPTSTQIKALDPDRSPPDEFIVRGRDVFLRLPNGVGKTRLTNAYLDSKLGTTSTLRNWRTVLKLVEMAEDGQGS